MTGSVEKLHVTGPLIAFPPVSCAPLTVAVYVAWYASGALGVIVAVLVVPSYEKVVGTTLFAASVSTNETVVEMTGLLNVAVIAPVSDAPVAPAPGVCVVTVGSVVCSTVLYTTSTQ